METLKYKGFIGSINIDMEDLSLYGKVLGLDKKTLILYEGKDLVELKQDFESAVDDYIEHCIANGLPLHKSYSGTFNVRISPELHAKIAMSAQSSGMSLNAYIQKVLASSFL
ncbi:MAG: type II toxin-antitoxin system HicB family antitoxin [Bacteroidales bacterium]|nr:type II toxin-antitoxin system HicB family antitoxin [Bacteroidales bacterium]